MALSWQFYSRLNRVLNLQEDLWKAAFPVGSEACLKPSAANLFLKRSNVHNSISQR